MAYPVLRLDTRRSGRTGKVLSIGLMCAGTTLVFLGLYAGSGMQGWNGTDWAIQSTPNPPGSTDSSLNGVDCSAPGVCVAVGAAEVNGVFSTLVEVRSH